MFFRAKIYPPTRKPVEKQKQSVLEIARQSGLLYDKLVGFVEDLRNVGIKLDAANDSYHQAMQKLKDSRKKGDTLLGRAEKIRNLGAKTSKRLPKELLDDPEPGPSVEEAE